MLPEVQDYLNKLEQARKAIDRNSDERYDNRYNIYLETVNNAWDELTKSNHKLVSWIASNTEIRDEYRDHAKIILQALPASVDELDKLSNDNGWCPTWERFRDKAIAADAIEFEYDIQMKIGTRGWQEFYELSFPKDEYLTKEMLVKFFSQGVSFMQFDFGNTTVKYQLKPKN